VPDLVLNLLALLPLLLVTQLADRLARLPAERRLPLKSFSGGVAAAYVFLLVLPKLVEQQDLLERAVSELPLVEYLYHHAYLLALGGFMTYYLVNLLAEGADVSVPRSWRGVVLLVGLCAYMALIGDLIGSQDPQPLPLALFSAALTFHMLGLDLAVYGRLMQSWRWLRALLSVSLLLGWLISVASALPPAVHALVSAWLAGGIIILVVLVELPTERRPLPFLAGALTFAALLKLNLLLTGVEGGV